MDMADGRGSHHPVGHGGDWSGESDPADEWVLDPVTGEYRMRLPEERLPALPAVVDDTSWQQDPAPEWRPVGERLWRDEPAEPDPEPRAVEPARSQLELMPAPGSRAAARAAADRRSRRGGGRRRNSGGSGGLWLAGTLGVVGLLGCGTGGYLLLHGGGKATVCSTAKPSAPPSAQTSTAGDAHALPSGPTASPLDVRVTVLNGSGVLGQAEAALNWMQNTEGYLRTSNGGPAKVTTTTSLVYAPDHVDQARALAAAMHLPPAALHGTGTATGQRDPMVLTLGKDFKTAGQPLAAPPAPTPTNTQAGCAT